MGDFNFDLAPEDRIELSTGTPAGNPGIVGNCWHDLFGDFV